MTEQTNTMEQINNNQLVDAVHVVCNGGIFTTESVDNRDNRFSFVKSFERIEVIIYFNNAVEFRCYKEGGTYNQYTVIGPTLIKWVIND